MEKEEFKIHSRVFIPPSRCINCNSLLDALTGVQSQTPTEGDISICAVCGQVMIFDSELKMRAATDTELIEIKTGNPDVYKFVKHASASFKAKRAMKNN
jgi:hypothetical protein